MWIDVWERWRQPTAAAVVLSMNMKQGVALGIMQSGKNVFLTGQAGSGKTYILNRYIDFLRAHEIDPVVCASTGIAATHLGGSTIHSWSGVGIKENITDYDIEILQEKQYLWKRFEHAKVLILDEISMISPDLLDSIDRILRAFKFSAEPFGGMQVIFSGDFFQLPPVNARNKNPERMYAWQSGVWEHLNLKICYLEEQHRQSGKSRLNRILNDIRDGAVSEDSMNLLRGRYMKEPQGFPDATKLYTHNVDVDRINQEALDALPALPRFFDMSSKGNKRLVETLKKGTLAPERLGVKVEAKVLFVKNNYEKGYMNGSVGVVTDFSEAGYPVVELVSGAEIIAEPETWSLEEGGKVLASVMQVPLRLAWAITIHKSQGMSLDSAEIDLSKAFESGQGYVALSRLRSLEGLKLMGCNKQALEVSNVVLEQDSTLLELAAEHQEIYEEFSEDEKLNRVESFLSSIGATFNEAVVIENTKKLKRKRRKKQTGIQTTHEKTKELVKQEYSIEEMAHVRELTESTILKHLEVLRLYEKNLDMGYLLPDEETIKQVQNARDHIERKNDKEDFLESGEVKLRALFDYLDGDVSYENIRLSLIA